LLGTLDVLIVLFIGSLTLVLGGLLDVPRSVEVLKKVIEDSDDGGDHTLVSLNWSSFDHFLDKDQNGVQMETSAYASVNKILSEFQPSGEKHGAANHFNTVLVLVQKMVERAPVQAD
jgi:hypothetical protein